jgi:predicted DNA-binding transcriptional regulator AlpA
MAGKLLTQNDLAAAVGVKPTTIRQWRLKGKLPEPDAVIGRTPAWTEEHVEEWLNKGYPVDGRKLRYKKKEAQQ